MNRIYGLIIAATMMAALNSCLGSDTPTSEYTMQPTLITRSIDTRINDNDNLGIIATTASLIKLDATNKTITMTFTAKLDGANTVSVQTPTMNYSQHDAEGTTMVFSGGTITAGTHTIKNFKGAYDFNGSIMVSCEVDDLYRLICMSAPIYPYASMNTTDLTTATSTAMGLNINTGKTIFAISPFRMNAQEEAVHELRYNDLPFTVTLNGYNATGTDVTPVSAATGGNVEKYKASSITIDLQNYGATMVAQFDADGKAVKLTGTMFSNGYLPL